MYTVMDFTNLLEEFCTIFDEMIAVEEEKLEAVKRNSLERIDECMKKEQAFLLKLRGVERKREAIQSDIGLPDKTLKDIIALEKDQSLKLSLSALFDKFEAKLNTYRSLQSDCKSHINEHLDCLNELLESAKEKDAFKSANDVSTYNSDGKHQEGEHQSFKSRKV